jgi:hypothetical protein
MTRTILLILIRTYIDTIGISGLMVVARIRHRDNQTAVRDTFGGNQ